MTPPCSSEPISQRLAAAEHTLVARDEIVPLDLHPEIGVAEPHPIADGRPEQLDVLLPRYPLAMTHAPLKPASRAAQSRAAVGRGLALGEAVEPVHATLAAEGDKLDLALVPRLEPHRGACRDVEPHAERAARSNSSSGLTSKKWKCEPTWIGRSPRLRTEKANGVATLVEDDVRLGEPELARLDTFGSLRPGADRIVDRDELLPVREHRLDLERADELRNAGQNVVVGQDAAPMPMSSATLPSVPGALADLVGDQCPSLGVVQPQAAAATAARELGSEEEQQPIGLLRAQMHETIPRVDMAEKRV